MTREKKILGSQALAELLSRLQDGTFRDIVADWKWIFSFSRQFRSRIVIYTLLGIVSNLLALAGSVTGKYLMDAILSLDARRLVWMIAATILLAALSLTLRSVSSRFSTRIGVDVNNHIQSVVLDSMYRSRWEELNRFASGDLIHRFGGDVSTITSSAVSWLPDAVIAVITLIAAFCIILYYDPMMALITFITVPFLLLSSKSLIRRQRAHNRRVKAVTSRFTAFQVEAFRGLDITKSFGVEDRYMDLLHRHQDEYRSAVLDYNRFSIRTNIWLSVLSTIVQYLAFGYCLLRLWQGRMLFSTMLLFLQQRGHLQGALSSVVSLIPSALSGSVSAGRVRELTELEKEPAVGTPPKNADRCSVLLENVSFSYLPGSPILENSGFIASPGETIALVGPSGEGKTTTLRLILGLVSPEKGKAVMVDGAGSETPLGPDTRPLLAYVPQGHSLMSGTIADNLRLVRPDATEEDLWEALRLAAADGFVSRLPGQTEYLLSEDSRGLSEGQAQRIAIARALLRKAPVLLLDEATSAIDITTERTILRNLAQAGKTCILTTHRPTALSLCTRVYRITDRQIRQLTPEQIEAYAADF
ncbi:MAG: ABC transporter ATP-binding protein [Oscillospiraceae bacterium]|nr:ABC transporter ATP-binding protein [Oscillospiraceae bacterium]